MFEYPYDPPMTAWTVSLAWLVIIPSVLVTGHLLLRHSRSACGSDSLAWGLAGIVGTVALSMIPATWNHFTPLMLVLWTGILCGMFLTIARFVRQRSWAAAAGGGVTLLLLICGVWVMVELPLAQRVTKSSNCKGNVKQIGLALMNYYDKYNSFPDSQSDPIPHSWRVALLPFMERTPLYENYDFGSEWDAPSNLPTARTLMPNYQCPLNVKLKDELGRAYSSYALVNHPDGIYSPNSPPRKLDEIPDGANQTLLFVEACGRNLIWTDIQDQLPSSLPLGINLPGQRPGESVSLLSSQHSNAALGLTADGSVRTISAKVSPEVLERMVRANDGRPGEF